MSPPPSRHRGRQTPYEGEVRLRWLLAAIAALAAIVMARVMALELWYGDRYREIAARPIERIVPVAAPRGRILAKDGTVLACDREVAALAIHYRYLQQPPDPAWLRAQARRRLPRRERRIAAKIKAECRRVEIERAALHQRLAQGCGMPDEALTDRLAKIQARVERIAAGVVTRRQEKHHGNEGAGEPGNSWWRERIAWFLELNSQDDLAEPVRVAEEYEYHPVFAGLSLQAVAEIEGYPERYPGVKIVTWRQRIYPEGPLAAHTLGYVPDASTEFVSTGGEVPAGQQGVERQYDSFLRGKPGAVREAIDRSGRLLESTVERGPLPGGDLTITIDPPLERAAEELLDRALLRRLARDGEQTLPGGGAIVALDVATGAVLCSASAPRFEPESLARGDRPVIERLFADRDKPLFDRASQMALPPGSVFKPLTAVALLEEGIVDPLRPFFCRGYWQTPEKQRCASFRQSRTGHGPLTLADALARSCNVYFFHYANELGGERLAAWAKQFGFAERSGIDLPDEASGNINGASDDDGSRDISGDEVAALAIGQGTLTATPLQVVRMMAALANGGRLLTPHIATNLARREGPPSAEAMALNANTLSAVCRGLARVVADPRGTAYGTVRLDSIAIAGKTGTAETGSGRSHAWFAGYAPVDRPKVALVVVVENAGDGSEAAGPVARRLIEKMQSLKYFARER
jgi:penicillin-binding protein 2